MHTCSMSLMAARVESIVYELSVTSYSCVVALQTSSVSATATPWSAQLQHYNPNRMKSNHSMHLCNMLRGRSGAANAVQVLNSELVGSLHDSAVQYGVKVGDLGKYTLVPPLLQALVGGLSGGIADGLIRRGTSVKRTRQVLQV